MYVNIENILEMLQGQGSDEDLFIGDIIFNAKPIRRRSSKYYVPEFVYGGGLYPSYAGGGGFVMSGFTARRLSAACRQVPHTSRSLLQLSEFVDQGFVSVRVGGAVPHRRRLPGNVPPGDRRQTLTPPGVPHLWDSAAVCGAAPSDVRPVFLQRADGRSQPQRAADLAHVEPFARPEAELPQQDQPDIGALQVEEKGRLGRGDGLR